ncbi:unnamed protein product [Trichobilharzia regenti]|nr:unnamed protein product [Trichobilharzia regenti]
MSHRRWSIHHDEEIRSTGALFKSCDMRSRNGENRCNSSSLIHKPLTSNSQPKASSKSKSVDCPQEYIQMPMETVS